MLLAAASFKGLAIEAQDGRIGAFSDFLFDDRTWKLRWMVVDTGHWLPGRKVLVHPSNIGHADVARGTLPVGLTREQVHDSPDIGQDQPVSRQMQDRLYGYYGWTPEWGGAGSFAGGMRWEAPPLPAYVEGGVLDADRAETHLGQADPHVRSLSAVTGYHLHATDGPIGHIKTFMVATEDWAIRYLAADTGPWWPGQHVLLAPGAVTSISWADREAVLGITRAEVKNSPPWS